MFWLWQVKVRAFLGMLGFLRLTETIKKHSQRTDAKPAVDENNSVGIFPIPYGLDRMGPSEHHRA
jgi:hypothetical protein